MNRTEIVVDFVKSQRGKDLLVVNDFQFHLRRITKNDEHLWYCSISTCKAKCRTQGMTNKITKYDLVHNHPVDLEKLSREALSNACKQKAVENLREKPSKLIDSEIVSSPYKKTLTVNDLNLVRRVINRNRLKIFPKIPHSNINDVGVTLPKMTTDEGYVQNRTQEVTKNASSETPLNLPKKTSQLKNQPAELRRKSLRNHISRDLTTSDIFEFLDENYKQEDTMTIKNQLLLLELSPKGNRATVTSQQIAKKMRLSGGINQDQESNESIEDDMINANEFLQLQQKHDLSVFFQSLEARVSQFSPELQLEAKTQLMNIVDQLEVTNMQSARITTSSNNFVPRNQFSENQFVSNCSKPSSSHETHAYTSLNLNTPMDEEFYPEEKVSIDEIDEFVPEEQEQIYNDEIDEFAPEQKVNVEELALNEHILASKPKQKTNINASECPPERKVNIEENRVLDPVASTGKVVKKEIDTDIHGIEFDENVKIKTEFDLYENLTVKKEFIVEENVNPDESDQIKNVNIDQFTPNKNTFADKFPDRKV